MQSRLQHPWNVTPAEAREIQESLRGQVLLRPPRRRPKFVAGVDVSVTKGPWKQATSRAAVVVLDYKTLEPLEVAVAAMPAPFPYVPGLLTFRECPVLLAAFEMLKVNPDLILVDGHGYSHPRRIGIATHLGLLLGTPTVGCAKKRFIGTYDEPAERAGSYTDLIDRACDPPEVIGAVVRTRAGVKPMFISGGHLMDTPTAIDHALALCGGFRLPEPTRLAHQCAAGRTLEELWRAWQP